LSKGGQVLGVLGAGTDCLRKLTKEIGPGSRELIAANKSAIFAKPILDARVVEGGQRDGCLADPSDTDKSNGRQVFSEDNDLFDELVASETGPRRWGR
jgi:hypothetical protein